MSTFLTLDQLVAHRQHTPVMAKTTSAIRLGVIRAVANGDQLGADLSALWTPKTGKNQGIPSKPDYVEKSARKLADDAGVSLDAVTFDTRDYDGTPRVVIFHEAAQAEMDAGYDVADGDEDES